MGIGHVRYPTHGLTRENEIQPFFNNINNIDGISLSHNGNITNYDYVLSLIQDKTKLKSSSDSELLLLLFIELVNKELIEKSKFYINNKIIQNVIKKIYNICRGSYSVLIMINNFGLIAFRDIYGIRPLVYSINKNYIEFASETIALKNSENYLNVKNGEVVIINKYLNINKLQIYDYPLTPCLFEYIYFARPESYINDILVYEFREKISEKIISIINKDNSFNNIDYVIPVPQTAIITSIKVAEYLKKPLKHAIFKNRYTHRTFINSKREKIVKNIKKIKIIKKYISNKKILVIDDSIVRGNTSNYIINELKKNNAKEIYLFSCSPPVRHPNKYGIAIPSHKELIAYNKTIEEIRKDFDIKKLNYLDLNSICAVLTQLNKNIINFESSVFNGNYII
jgi:amidophosphoribosyltransferase